MLYVHRVHLSPIGVKVTLQLCAVSFKIFVIVRPKQGLAGRALSDQSSFGMTLTVDFSQIVHIPIAQQGRQVTDCSHYNSSAGDASDTLFTLQ